MSIRLVIVDDQGMVRAGFRSLLADEEDFEVVGEAANGEEAVEVVSRLAPDVTLMDIRMPVLDGIAATRRLVGAGVETRVLVLTTFDLDESSQLGSRCSRRASPGGSSTRSYAGPPHLPVRSSRGWSR
jgi:DNA-binding NarL/FixJ family response regulator